jgi:hypothetical protein
VDRPTRGLFSVFRIYQFHTGDFCVVASKITREKDKVICHSEFNGWSDLLAHPTDTKAPEARHELAFTTEEVATYAQ